MTGGLQFNSTPQRNLLKDGFLAQTRDDELSNGPGSRVFVTTSVVEVTDAITGGIDAEASPTASATTPIDRRVKERVAACEKDGSRCSVASFFEGLKYFEIAQLEIKDVRLVYAPAEGIGVFGGETDNWRWPRHTGDWSYLRAYVGKDGKPAAYAKDNVPYKPKHWLKVAAGGRQARRPRLRRRLSGPHAAAPDVRRGEGDRPSGRSRARSGCAEEQLALIDDARRRSNPALAIKLAGRVQGLNNGLTNSRGVLEGPGEGRRPRRRSRRRSRSSSAWIAANPARQKKYGDGAAGAARRSRREGETTRERNAALGLLLVRLVLSRRGADALPPVAAAAEGRRRPRRRVPGARLDADPRRPGPAAAHDRPRSGPRAASLGAGTGRGAAGRPADRRRWTRLRGPDGRAWTKADGRGGDRRRISTASTPARSSPTATSGSALLDKSTAELVATRRHVRRAGRRPGAAGRGEPRGGQEPRRRLRADPARLHGGAARARPAACVAPDANSTLRVTYGQVKGVDTRDGLFYKPQTTLQGIVREAHRQRRVRRAAEAARRHQGAAGRQDDRRIVDTGAQRRAGQLPVHRGHDRRQLGLADAERQGRARSGCSSTGPTSRSSSDYLFDSVKTRSIHVDSRYMLWTMAEVDGAKRLLDEMGVSLAARPPRWRSWRRRAKASASTGRAMLGEHGNGVPTTRGPPRWWPSVRPRPDARPTGSAA
ncbi:MAG: S46 family peptidase [Chromatiales bacterium]|nr:S46 family peptidase [Chromatiales bacterium]